MPGPQYIAYVFIKCFKKKKKIKLEIPVMQQALR